MAVIIRGKNPIFFFPMFAKDFVMCFRCVCVCCVELGREYILVCMFVCLHSPFLVWQGRGSTVVVASIRVLSIEEFYEVCRKD